MEPLDSVSNNLIDILYYLHCTLKLDSKHADSKNILTKTRMTLRDLEKMKNNKSKINLLVR
jgi:hypothetical protein